MSIRKIFWSMLAGMSLAMAGCDDGKPVPNPPEYGPPPDYSTDDLSDQASDDVLAEDVGEEEEELPAFMYGPQPEYGPPPP
jgi:hypothetical protein